MAFILNLVFDLLVRWLFPSRAHEEYPTPLLEESYRKHIKHYLFAWLLAIVLTPTAIAGWGGIIWALISVRDHFMLEHLLMVRLEPVWINIALPSLFLGMISAWFLTIATLKRLYGRETFGLLQAASHHKEGVDQARLMRWLSIGSVFLSFSWIILTVDWYTRFESNRVAFSPLFGFGEKAYTYAQVTDLAVATHLIAPGGNLVSRDRQFIVFDDGERWCHDGLLLDAQPLMDLLTERTGKTFRHVRFIEDLK